MQEGKKYDRLWWLWLVLALPYFGFWALAAWMIGAD